MTDLEHMAREFFGGANGALAASSSGTTSNAPAPTAGQILDAIQEVMRSLPPEPFGQWMREQGCPPELWDLHVPDVPAVAGLMLPAYVKVSRIIDQPVLIARSASQRVF
jgi:hypothetical protein